MMCADGFLPAVIEDEPPRFEGDLSLSYFTCCPPYNLASSTNVTRFCSDPVHASVDWTADDGDGENIDALCDSQDSRSQPRRTKSISETYVCCDNNNNNNSNEEYGESVTTATTNFLDDVECVPYRNDFYETAVARNYIGMLGVVWCDVLEGDFNVPRPLGDGSTTDDLALKGMYQCCRNGDPLPPFVQDSAFKLTVYPLLALCSVAAIVSLVVAVALLVPLLIQLKQKKLKQGSLTFERGSAFVQSSTSVASERPKRRKPSYSMYNLYSAYLAILDLIFCLFQMGFCGSYLNQQFDPDFYGGPVTLFRSTYSIVFPHTSMNLVVRTPEGPFIFAYFCANMWMNVVIAYQVLVLLRSSERAQRINQPSFARVNLQTAAVCFSSVLFGTIIHFMVTPLLKAQDRGDFETVKTFSIAIEVWMLLVLMVPIAYVLWVTIRIWWKGYIPSLKGATTRARAMRQLAFYFSRIVMVFVSVWFPAMIMVIYSMLSQTYWWLLLALCLFGLQPILSTIMVLTKDDTRKYVLDLATLSYLSGKNNEASKSGINRTASTSGFFSFWNSIQSSRRIRSAANVSFTFIPANGANAKANAEENADDDSAIQSNADPGSVRPTTVSPTGEVVSVDAVAINPNSQHGSAPDSTEKTDSSAV
jgi:hypothetical protein